MTEYLGEQSTDGVLAFVYPGALCIVGAVENDPFGSSSTVEVLTESTGPSLLLGSVIEVEW